MSFIWLLIQLTLTLLLPLVAVPMCTGKGEKWLPCGEYKNCGPVCGKLNEPCTIQYFQCPFGCQCPHGMAQVPGTRNCIKEEQCDQVERHCPKNMHWSDCASPCTDNCDCNLKCKGPCEKRCVCNEDYAMFENSICKPRDECEVDL